MIHYPVRVKELERGMLWASVGREAALPLMADDKDRLYDDERDALATCEES